jgi:hypothetical protein
MLLHEAETRERFQTENDPKDRIPEFFNFLYIQVEIVLYFVANKKTLQSIQIDRFDLLFSASSARIRLVDSDY